MINQKASVRIEKQLINKISCVVNKKKNIYTNNSHFIRCAIIRLLRLEAEKDIKNIKNKSEEKIKKW